MSSENRIDGMCSNNTANAAAMVGNSAITAGNNFNSGADSVLLAELPAGAHGERPERPAVPLFLEVALVPPRFGNLERDDGRGGSSTTDAWNNPANPSGDDVSNFLIFLGTGYFHQTIFDYIGTWNWRRPTPDAATIRIPETRLPTSSSSPSATACPALATPTTYFAYGHEHADLRIFRRRIDCRNLRRDIAFDNDNLGL